MARIPYEDPNVRQGYPRPMSSPCQELSLRLGEMNMRLAEMTAQRDDLLAALEAVEYDGGDGPAMWCPWCRTQEGYGHKPDCQRQAAIAKAKGGVMDKDQVLANQIHLHGTLRSLSAFTGRELLIKIREPGVFHEPTVGLNLEQSIRLRDWLTQYIEERR